MRSKEEWLKWCDKITAGYTPGGRKHETYYQGIKMVEFLHSISLIKSKSFILDVGSGNGRLAMGLEATNFDGSYRGLEIIQPCVDFCEMAFRDLMNYGFYHLNVRNIHYWPLGIYPPEEVIFPFYRHTFDLVVAMSLFSHTGTYPAARRYLEEMKRVLKSDGDILTTWYFGPEHRAGEDKTVYNTGDILAIFRDLSLEYSIIPWNLTDQIVILLWNSGSKSRAGDQEV